MSQQRFLACVLVFCALAWSSSQARAQADFGQRIWWNADHNSLSAEVNRVIGVPSATYPAAGSPSVNGAHFTNAPGQWPVANQKTNLPFPGKSAPIDVVAKVKPASVGAAFGRLVQKAGPLANAVALVTFAAEVGFILTDGANGSPEVKKQSAPPSGYDGFEYREQNVTGSTWFETKQIACESHAASIYTGSSNYYSCHNVGVYPNFQVALRSGSGSIINLQDRLYVRRTDPTPFVAQQVPATSTEFADKIASESGWPSNSHIREALAEAIRNGETVEYDPAQVSGPATRPGASSTTTAPDGTVTTVTVNHNYTYNGPKVTVTSTTTTTTTAPGGSPVTTVKTDTEPAPEASPEEDTGTPTDTALPGQPELYTPEYPDGLKGVWNAKQSQLQALPILDLLTDLMPNVAASGTCPSWTLDMDLYIVDYGAHIIAIPCWIWDFGKVVIICSALLLSRRLIFGG